MCSRGVVSHTAACKFRSNSEPYDYPSKWQLHSSTWWVLGFSLPCLIHCFPFKTLISRDSFPPRERIQSQYIWASSFQIWIKKHWSTVSSYLIVINHSRTTQKIYRPCNKKFDLVVWGRRAWFWMTILP